MGGLEKAVASRDANFAQILPSVVLIKKICIKIGVYLYTSF